MQNYGWIELVLFYGVAIGFGLWQWLKMRRELRQSREERARKEAEEAATAAKEGEDDAAA